MGGSKKILEEETIWRRSVEPVYSEREETIACRETNTDRYERCQTKNNILKPRIPILTDGES